MRTRPTTLISHGAPHWLRTTIELLAILSSLATPASHAAEINAADTAWILTSSGLVLFMTVPGLAMFYGGLVRARNVLSVLAQCFAITAACSMLWVIAGYSLALTDGGPAQPWIGGLDRIFLQGLNAETMHENLPEAVFCMYHMTFAIFAPALIVGSLVERIRFSALLIFASLWMLMVYVPVCHWLWGQGWLANLGAMDFAGGIVVHAAAGTAALTAATMLGPRKGFPRLQAPPHNLTLTATGAGILWVGWHGFSAGSALMANGSAAMAMLTTHIGAATGSLVWMTVEWIRFGKPTLLGIVTGMIAGLGMIAPAAGYVSPAGAIVIGIIAGAIGLPAIHLIKQQLKIDDSLDVFPVHGLGGILGALLTGILASEMLGGTGLAAEGGIPGQLAAQLIAITCTVIWSGQVSWIILKLIDRHAGGLRVSSECETEGLDIRQHEEQGYNL